MATPALTASTRFFDVANTKIYYLPTISATNLTPTRAEMTAGVNLTSEIIDLVGWVVDAALFDTQNLQSPFQTFAPGNRSTPPSSLLFYTSKNGIDVRNTLSPGVTGYILFLDGGDIAGNRAECYPITVAAIGVLRNAGNDTSGNSSTTMVASLVRVAFAITSAPNQAVVVPA